MPILKWFLLFIVLLTACTAVSNEPTEVEAVAEVVTVAPTRAELTATVAVTKTAIATATATATAVPSPTPTTVVTKTAEPAPDQSGQYILNDPMRIFCKLNVIQVTAETIHVEHACRNWQSEEQTAHFVQELVVVENTAVFYTTAFAQSCEIIYTFDDHLADVTQTGSWQDCGFGGDINVSGVYSRNEEPPVLSCQPAECEPTPYAVPAAEVQYTSESPVDTWTAVVERGYFDGNLQEEMRLRVTHTQNGTEWIADRFEIIDFSDQFNNPKPVHWSSDGRYLYFTHDRYADGCTRPRNSTDLQQLNLATGEVVPIYREGYWFSFAPDDQKLAYLSEENGLVIWDLTEGAGRKTIIEIESGPDLVYLANLRWSADNQSLLMIAYLNPCTMEGERHAIVYVDANSLVQFTHVFDDFTINSIKEWPQWNMVLLSLSGEPNMAWLNLETGEFTAVSP